MSPDILAWWLVVEGIGLLALPLAFVLFRRLPDRGYAFAKPVGILLGGYLFWLALTANVLPNRPGSIVWSFILLAIVSGLVFRARCREILDELGSRMGVIIVVEAIFTIGFFMAAYLRSFIPEIDGTEKPMDFMFMNAASRSRYYPPGDPWMAGFDVSYYYFGYVIHAMLGKLSAQQMSVAYNLGLAGTAALAMTAAFGVGYNLVAMARRATVTMALAAGIGAALLIAVMGNLEGALEFAKANGVGTADFFGRFGVANLAEAAQSQSWYPTDTSSFWWWWRATRVCSDANCIMEFPFFSFLLGDLHPHVMAIPFVLTAVGLAMALWRSDRALDFQTWQASPFLLLLAAVLVGGLGFLNTWDLPTFGFVLTLLVLARNLRETGDWRQAASDTAGFVAPLAAVAAIAYLPFYVTFHSQAAGLGAVNNGATRPVHALLIWLPLVLLTLPVPLLRLIRDPASRTSFRWWTVAVIPAALVALWAVVLAADGDSLADAIAARGWDWLTALFFSLAFCVSALALWRAAEVPDEDGERDAVVPMLALTVTAMLLVLGAELFYVKDIFGSRLNTVFKLYYQAWLLLGCAGAFGIYWLVQEWLEAREGSARARANLWGGAITAVIFAALLYPLGATLSRTDGLDRPGRTLDGMAFVKRSTPGEIGAAEWLRTRAGQGEFIAEAILGQYSIGGRISGRSGVPAVLGWPGHERQWGRGDGPLGEREAAITQAYSTDSLAEAVEILQQYDVTYVVVGNVERAKYPAAGLQKFNSGLESVYRNDDTVIYRLPLRFRDPGGRTP